MLNSDADTVHKYNVATWLQDIERQVIAQRAKTAKAFIVWGKAIANTPNADYLKQCFIRQRKILNNLHNSRMKLYKEQQQLNSVSDTNKATNLYTFPLQISKT